MMGYIHRDRERQSEIEQKEKWIKIDKTIIERHIETDKDK